MEFIVDRVVDSKEQRLNGKTHSPTRLYLTRWLGFGPDEDTWEPETSFDGDDLIKRWKTRSLKHSKVVFGEPVPSSRPPKTRCALCFEADAAKLFVCAGWCRRSFCLKCFSTLDAPADGWLCPDCRVGRGECMFCRRRGQLWHASRAIPAPDNAVLKKKFPEHFRNARYVHVCSAAECGTMFHISCAVRARRLRVLRQDSEHGRVLKLICHRHTCAACGETLRGVVGTVSCVHCGEAVHNSPDCVRASPRFRGVAAAHPLCSECAQLTSAGARDFWLPDEVSESLACDRLPRNIMIKDIRMNAPSGAAGWQNVQAARSNSGGRDSQPAKAQRRSSARGIGFARRTARRAAAPGGASKATSARARPADAHASPALPRTPTLPAKREAAPVGEQAADMFDFAGKREVPIPISLISLNPIQHAFTLPPSAKASPPRVPLLDPAPVRGARRTAPPPLETPEVATDSVVRARVVQREDSLFATFL